MTSRSEDNPVTREEFAALHARVTALEARYCSRCGERTIAGIVSMCGEDPCPVRHLLRPRDWEWRRRWPQQIHPAKLPILATDGSSKNLSTEKGMVE